MSFNSNAFNSALQAVYLPSTAEVVIGSSNSIISGQGAVTLTKLSIANSNSSAIGTTFLSSTASNLTLTLPSVSNSNLPYPQNVMTFSAGGIGAFNPAQFQYSYTNNGALMSNSVLFSGTGSTLGGKASIALTKVGGSNIFNTVTSVTSSGWHVNPNINGAVFTSVYASSPSNLIISAFGNNGALFGNELLNPVADGSAVSVLVVGY